MDRQLSKYIDHTNFKPMAQKMDIEKLCTEAARWQFASVCVNPYNVPLAKALLKGTDVNVCTVIGFPLGANTTKIKVMEAREAYENGCDEFDMVINIGALKDGLYDYVRDEIKAVVEAVEGRTVKVIIETGLLTEYEKSMATKLACDAGAQFVKTCTGVSPGKATVEDVKLMLENIPEYEDVQVKASSGIRTYEDAIALIEAGAERLGTSSGIAIIEGAEIVGAL